MEDISRWNSKQRSEKSSGFIEQENFILKILIKTRKQFRLSKKSGQLYSLGCSTEHPSGYVRAYPMPNSENKEKHKRVRLLDLLSLLLRGRKGLL